MVNNKDLIVERALQNNFRTGTPTTIPDGWRKGLREKLSEQEAAQPLKEEILFIKYEKRFWNAAWISFAAGLFIFLSLIYILNRDRLSLKQTVSRQMYECLTMEDKL